MEHGAYSLWAHQVQVGRGFEGELNRQKEGAWTLYVCPECGCDVYMFMTSGEIKAWERKKAKEVTL